MKVAFGPSMRNYTVSDILIFGLICPVWVSLVGPISCVTALGTTFIILNDIEAAFELLDKRSAIYSSRYETTFGAKM